MSSTPNLPLIDAALLAACTITAGVGSYNFTIPSASISLAQRDIKSIALSSQPQLDIVFQGEDSGDQPTLRRVVATYLITGYVATTATTDALAATERRATSALLRDDLKAAIYGSSALHGAAATSVKIREYVDTTGVSGERDSTGGQATVRLLVDVVYFERYTLSPPTS